MIRTPELSPFGFTADVGATVDAACRFDVGVQQGLAAGYDAIRSDNKRKRANGLLRSEDSELNEFQRRQLLSSARDIQRNFTVAAWMIRRHLDYVTTFSFQAKTDNKALNAKLQSLVADWSKPENFDVAGRHSRQRALRLAEARRTVDGDVLVARISDGRTQWIEGDRIREASDMPATLDRSRLVHGVQVNAAGRAQAYCICRRGNTADRNSSQFFFERLLTSQNAYLHACFDRFDQVRGVSPIASSLNDLRDCYEAFDYARAKMKVSQLFGLVFYREMFDDDEPRVSSSEDGSGYEVNFGRGPVQLDLDPGDRAEFLESQTPSTEFQNFSNTMILIALKSLDIPYSFFNEAFTNYSGARGALQIYDRACEVKRTENRNLLDWLTSWRTALFIQDGKLPGADPAAINWEWHAQGLPWIDPLKEVLANNQAIGGAMNTRTRILREQGLDFEDIVAELQHEAELLKAAGLPLNIDDRNALVAALTEDKPHAKA